MGGTVTVPQRLTQNNPRNGYTHRIAESVTDSAGATVNVREFFAMGLRGMGISSVYLPNNLTVGSNATYSISIDQ